MATKPNEVKVQLAFDDNNPQHLIATKLLKDSKNSKTNLCAIALAELVEAYGLENASTDEIKSFVKNYSVFKRLKQQGGVLHLPNYAAVTMLPTAEAPVQQPQPIPQTQPEVVTVPTPEPEPPKEVATDSVISNEQDNLVTDEERARMQMAMQAFGMR